MKRLVLATAILMAGTAVASADPCVINPSTPTYAPDDTIISLLYDSFSATVGNNGTCAPSIDAHSNVLPNDPDVFEVYTSDIRGDTFFPTMRSRSQSRPMVEPTPRLSSRATTR